MNINSQMTRNRAEEYGFDIWEDFVIPPYFPKLELMKSEKPQIIEGGRGSGKTMLLRYLCHTTQFSKHRKCIPNQEYHRIGIYWKMDIAFSSIMNARGASDSLWTQAFINMAVLILSSEIIDSLYNISLVNESAAAEISNIDFSDLQGFDESLPSTIDDLKKSLHRKFLQFQTWVSNYKKISEPLFYPKCFLDELINIIKSEVSVLSDSFYSVYIDEYENLNVLQKRIVNTWIKQSQAPIIFNIAMKHAAFDVADTLGDEKIVEVHDYRKINLEMLLNEHFSTFASEIFLLKVQKNCFHVLEKFEYLYDTSEKTLNFRTSKKYKNLVQELIEKIFPKLSEKENAALVLEDKTLSRRFDSMLKKDFKLLNEEKYYSLFLQLKPEPEALIVLHALLNRKNIQITSVYNEMEKYCKKENSRFDEWIHTNLFGCILNFYGGLNRPCPLYTGYETFVTMSKDNIRHFLELCYTALSLSDDIDTIHRVSYKDQMLAVKSVSNNMLFEIKRFGPKGNKLFLFAMRLGNLFEELRKRDSQSEPEQNQFSISDSPTPECEAILQELVKWSVLYETKLTKQKGHESGFEYQINPIYSAFFNISYRKKRRIELTSDEVMQMCEDSDVNYQKTLKRFTQNFSQDENDLMYFGKNIAEL